MSLRCALHVLRLFDMPWTTASLEAFLIVALKGWLGAHGGFPATSIPEESTNLSGNYQRTSPSRQGARKISKKRTLLSQNELVSLLKKAKD